LERMVTRVGFTACGIAPTAREGIDLITARKPDVVLADVHLGPGIDGIRVGTHVRASSRAVLIYLTAFTDDETLERAKITNPEGYLVKPINERQLHAVLSMALYRTVAARTQPEIQLTPREVQVVECIAKG